MRIFVTASIAACLVMACDPQAPDEPEPLGGLEFEHSYVRIHRLDRRVDVVLVEGDEERRECGVLSDRAYVELEDTLAALDPREDYGYDAAVDQCTTPPGASVHIEGFDHSPFSCDFQCCRGELARAGLVYSLIEYHFHGGTLPIDGEPYVAVERDEPCP
jgi:hypothetical protein